MIELNRQKEAPGTGRIDSADLKHLPPATQGRGSDYFPNIMLAAHDGKHYLFHDDLIRTRVVLINFMSIKGHERFPATQFMQAIARRLGPQLGRQVHLYSISTDIRDTPARLRRFAAQFDVSTGWLFLTAASRDVQQISRRLYPDYGHHSHGAGHSPRLVHYGNGEVGVWGAFGVDSDPALACERISWVATAGTRPTGPARRAGPGKLQKSVVYHGDKS